MSLSLLSFGKWLYPVVRASTSFRSFFHSSLANYITFGDMKDLVKLYKYSGLHHVKSSILEIRPVHLVANLDIRRAPANF